MIYSLVFEVICINNRKHHYVYVKRSLTPLRALVVSSNTPGKAMSPFLGWGFFLFSLRIAVLKQYYYCHFFF